MGIPKSICKAMAPPNISASEVDMEASTALPKNGTGYPLGTILRGCFTQAQSRHNAQVGHIVLQHNQHNGRQGHHPQQRVTKFGTGCKIEAQFPGSINLQ